MRLRTIAAVARDCCRRIVSGIMGVVDLLSPSGGLLIVSAALRFLFSPPSAVSLPETHPRNMTSDLAGLLPHGRRLC